MARKTRRLAWLKKLFRSTRGRRQSGGSPSIAFTGPAFTGASGVPIEDRIGSDIHGEFKGGRSPVRSQTPHSYANRGGRRSRRSRRRKQRGAGCGCNMRGGRLRSQSSFRSAQFGGRRSRRSRQFGGHRPFGFELDNSLGKVYSSVGQIGGRRRRSRRQRGGRSRSQAPQNFVFRGGYGNSSADLLGITSTRAGFSMNQPFSSDSATFMEYTPYKG